MEKRYRFRHPLLRDFALGYWCLCALDSSGVVTRWIQIAGGIQRHGALRAILEAFSDESFAQDFPHLNRGNVLAALLREDDGKLQLAQVLGLVFPSRAFDPAGWPAEMQAILPETFGRDVIATARLALNSSWAVAIQGWNLQSPWIDDAFPSELVNFVQELQRSSRSDTTLTDANNHAKTVAAKLREASEHPRFQDIFGQYDRHLMMEALLAVVPLLPDELTLAWVEREMPRASWRTRSFILQTLVHLAKVNEERAGKIFCAAIGISKKGDKWNLDQPFRATMDHQAMEWSLGGEHGHRGLIQEHPKTFFPIAVNLTGALSHSGEAKPDEIINDLPDWFWGSITDDHGRRCIRVIHNTAKQMAGPNFTKFFEICAATLESSKLLTVHASCTMA